MKMKFRNLWLKIKLRKKRKRPMIFILTQLPKSKKIKIYKTYYLEMRKLLYRILEFYFELQLASILPKILIRGINLFWKSKMEISFQNGLINILKAISASTESSFLSKEIDIWDLKEIKNMNWSTSAEDIWSI